jgi:hypothetical protein
VTLTDWILSLHVLSAVALVGGMTALWALLLATRPRAGGLPGSIAAAIAAPVTAALGLGLLGTIVFGVWLAIDLEAYHPWDPWIVASLVLWLVAGGMGDRARNSFLRTSRGDPDAAAWGPAVRSHAGASAAALLMLVLMIWKPGA